MVLFQLLMLVHLRLLRLNNASDRLLYKLVLLLQLFGCVLLLALMVLADLLQYHLAIIGLLLLLLNTLIQIVLVLLQIESSKFNINFA
jgi:hypothetical protein